MFHLMRPYYDLMRFKNYIMHNPLMKCKR
jgi:hypothetical protein